MIEISNLKKQYGKIIAVDNISFNVENGEILGLLGPNGAGKTTTMNMITGYISYTDGEILIDGKDINTNPMECKKKIGYLPEIPPLYPDMTTYEYLDFVCDIKGVEDKKQHIEEILSLVKIKEIENRLIKNLSKGYKQRLGIAQSLIGNPEILILDEPTSGLDPLQIIEIRKLIKELKKEHTIIISSHILPEISAICERVVIINKGKIVAIDTPDNLSKKLSSGNRFIVRVSGKELLIFDAITKIDGVKSVEKLGEKENGTFDFSVETDGISDIRKTLSISLSDLGFAIYMINEIEMSLEDVFLKLTNVEKEIQTTDETEEEKTDEKNESNL